MPALGGAVPDDLVQLDHRLTGIERAGNGGVRLAFANGRTVEADAAIGADGVNSVVKDALFGKDDPISSTASPIAPSSRRACSTASTSATAPNGGRGSPHRHVPGEGRPLGSLFRHQPARSPAFASSPGRRKAT